MASAEVTFDETSSVALKHWSSSNLKNISDYIMKTRQLSSEKLWGETTSKRTSPVIWIVEETTYLDVWWHCFLIKESYTINTRLVDNSSFNYKRVDTLSIQIKEAKNT